MHYLKEFEFKKIGQLEFDKTAIPSADSFYKEFIKIILLNKGSNMVIDFTSYKLSQDTLFFVGPGQVFKIDEKASGIMLFYNRDFYCIEIHDKEVACDGILFNNVFQTPVVNLSTDQSDLFRTIFSEIREELSSNNYVMEEMLRLLLKELIIRSTRLVKCKNEDTFNMVNNDVDLMRKFSQLVELHYKTKHAVADYANLLNITPKALTKRIAGNGTFTPNEIIKNRIMLEAKRLLAHTDLSVKEVGYSLCYDDPAYFIRMFTKNAQVSPQVFRKKYR